MCSSPSHLDCRAGNSCFWESKPWNADVPWCGGSAWKCRESIPVLSLGAEIVSRQEVDLFWIREFLNWLCRNCAPICSVCMEITCSNSAEDSWKLDNVLDQRQKWVLILQKQTCRLGIVVACTWLVGNNLHNRNNLRKAVWKSAYVLSASSELCLLLFLSSS